MGIVGQRLSYEELQTTIEQIGISHCFTFPDGIITGDIFSKASCLPFVTLGKGLRSTLLSNAGSLEYNVAVKKLPYMFDPHAMIPKGVVAGKGKAILLIFVTTDANR